MVSQFEHNRFDNQQQMELIAMTGKKMLGPHPFSGPRLPGFSVHFERLIRYHPLCFRMV